MSTSKTPVSDLRKTLEKEIESQRRDLENKRLDVNKKTDESIGILIEKISQKRKELDDCSWIRCKLYAIIKVAIVILYQNVQ